MKTRAPKRFKRSVKVPIFDADVLLLVAEDPAKEWGAFAAGSGECPQECEGFCAANGCGSFILYVHPDHLRPSVICHEIHHLTRGILEWTCVVEKGHHETAAHLCGWLSEWVMGQLERL